MSEVVSPTGSSGRATATTPASHSTPLTTASAARVVTPASSAAKSGRLDLGDLQSWKDYQPKRTYGRSQLAQMCFGLELDRRLRAGRSTVTSLVVHPDGALDSLTPSRPQIHVRTSGARLRGAPAALLLQGKHAGAWPAVRAVLDPDVRGGHLWGSRVLGLRGKPRQEPVWNHLSDAWTAARFWDASCDLTAVGLGTFPGKPHSLAHVVRGVRHYDGADDGSPAAMTLVTARPGPAVTVAELNPCLLCWMCWVRTPRGAATRGVSTRS